MPEPEAALLVTRVTVPGSRSPLLQRRQLLESLDKSVASRLTLLLASAGFGKTTLLSTWASQSTSPIAWLALDDEDNDPTRFWTYVIASLRRAGIPVGEAALAMLHAPQPSTLSVALTSLINEIAALPQEAFLILDDYHVINDPAIHDSIQYLLDHCPARPHLLIASRADPPLRLARLRARGQVLEINRAHPGNRDARLVRGRRLADILEEPVGRPAARAWGYRRPGRL